MAELDDRYRERYYRETLTHVGKPMTPEVYQYALNHLNTVMDKLKRDPRVRPFIPETAKQQNTYIASHYPNTPEGLGIRQGEFITIPIEDSGHGNDFIVTDNLIDCHALVLVARDKQKHVLATQLSHIDVKTDLRIALPHLLASMPPGSSIEATVIGSPHSYSLYMQADLMEMLAKAPGVHRIRYNFDAASTVAVESSTGKILTANHPLSHETDPYRASEFPIHTSFSSLESLFGLTRQGFEFAAFTKYVKKPLFDLGTDYQPGKGRPKDDELAQFLIDRQANDGIMDRTELQAIARRIGSEIKDKVTLEYNVGENGYATVDIVAPNGTKIDRFVNAKLDPSLGSKGSISER